MRHIIILLAFVVLVSGCVGSGGNRPIQIDSSNGVIINEFSVDPLTVDEDELVFFSVDIENVGGREATDVEIFINGLIGTWRDDCSSGGEVTDESLKTIESLSQPDKNINRAGDFQIAATSFCPPDLPEGVNADFPVTAKAEYTYKTTATFVIPLIGEEEYDNRLRTNRPVENTITTQNTGGPLKFSLSRGDAPIIVPENDDAEPTFLFKLSNVGSGFPITDGNLGELTSTTVTATPSDANIDCGDFEDNGQLNVVKLRSDGSMPIACSFDFSSGSVTTERSLIITFDIEYPYFVEKRQTISVRGRE